MQMIRTIRSLDGIFYSFLALLVLLLHPTAGRDPLGGIDLFCVLPVFALAWFCQSLPPNLMEAAAWRRGIYRLRLSSLAFAGLAPFAVWWLRHPGSNYLAVNFTLCMLSGSCVAFFLAMICGQLCTLVGRRNLALEARLAQDIVFWGLVIIGFGGITLVLLISVFFFNDSTPGQRLASFLSLAGNLRQDSHAYSRWPGIAAALIAIAPVVFLLSLIVRLRFALLAHLRDQKEPS